MIAKKNIFNVLAQLCVLITLLFSCNNAKENNQSGNQNPLYESISNSIKEDPNNADHYFKRANLLYEQTSYDMAISDLTKAISLDSSIVDYYHLLSDVYLDYFKSGEALDVMEKAVEKFPKSIKSLLKLSELQLTLKQYDASFFTVQKILNQDKQNAEAFFMLGMIYRAQGDKERAINSFQSAVELDPEIVDAWIILGDLFAEKDFKIAEKYYDNAIRINPENVQTYHAKAFYLQNNNRIDEAIALYKIIISKDPNYSDAFLNSGILYLEKDSLDRAFESFNQMVSVEPENYLGYYYRGVSRMFNNDKIGAKSDLEYVLKLNPSFEKAQQALENL